jgi:hypothetical protein
MMTAEHAKCLESALQEMEDLKTFWKDLAWWERDGALNNVFDLIFEIQNIHEFKVRCQMIQAKAEEYAVMNENNYPSDKALASDSEMELYYAGNPRLPQGQTIDLLRGLQDDDIKHIASNIGIDTEDDREALISATSRSMSAFYAIRNSVGTYVAQEVQRAQKAFMSHYDLT